MKSVAIEPVQQQASDWLSGHIWKAALLISAVVAVVSLGRSSGTLFSYDEYVTYRIAALPRALDVWHFFGEGLDTTGPLSALVAHAAGISVNCPEVISRLPFWLLSMAFGLGMFGFLRRRYPAGIALSALLLPLEMPKVAGLLIQARAYPIVLGCTGLAVWLWQSAAEGRGRPWSVAGLWCALALAMNAHFYAMLLVVPFALAQFTAERGRETDRPVWLAILLAPLGWLPVASGELLAHQYYAEHFWSKPSLGSMGDAYEDCLMESWPVLLVFMVFVVGVAVFQVRSGKRLEQGSSSGMRPAEWVLGIALILLPVYACVVALLVGAFCSKYAIACSAGLILCLLAGAGELCRRNQQAAVGFFVMIALLFVCNENGEYFVGGVEALLHPTQVHGKLQAEVQQQEWVQRLSSSSLPVAVDNDTYRLLDFYGQPELARRVWGLTDVAEAVKYEGAMTDQTNLVQFSKRLTFRTMDVDGFLHDNPHFLMVVQRPGRHYEWLPQYLLAKQNTTGGPVISLLEQENQGKATIYEVQMGTPLQMAETAARTNRGAHEPHGRE
jgi:hypothetical protein